MDARSAIAQRMSSRRRRTKVGATRRTNCASRDAPAAFQASRRSSSACCCAAAIGGVAACVDRRRPEIRNNLPHPLLPVLWVCGKGRLLAAGAALLIPATFSPNRRIPRRSQLGQIGVRLTEVSPKNVGDWCSAPTRAKLVPKALFLLHPRAITCRDI